MKAATSVRPGRLAQDDIVRIVRGKQGPVFIVDSALSATHGETLPVEDRAPGRCRKFSAFLSGLLPARLV
jgi:predicted metal-dependent TIM-barrel fold hydrolase